MTLLDEVPQGEIVTEVEGRVILVHGIGINPLGTSGLRGRWNGKTTHREWAERLAVRFVAEPRVVLVSHHKTGRIYAVRSLHTR